MTLPTVLLVDRDSDSLSIYSLILEHHGYRVVRTETEEDGFRAACEEDPGLVVADPFLRGPSAEPPLTTRLRQDPRTVHLPVLAVSTRTVPIDHPVRQACDAYLCKPCVPSRLLREVRRLLASAVELS